MFKEPSFYCQGLLDPKYLLDSRTLEETWKSVIKRLPFNNTFDKSYINVWKTIKKRTKWHFQWAIYRKVNICVLPFATVLLSFCILRILMKANNWYLWSWKLSTKWNASLVNIPLLLFSAAFNWGELCKNQQNEMASLTARNFKKIYCKFSDVRYLFLHF